MQSITIKDDIDELKQQLDVMPSKYEIPTSHMFLNGMYYREMRAVKNTMLIGATHKVACYNILLKGTIVVSNGVKEVILEAPCTFISAKGVQKIGYCLTEVIWANVFRTEVTTVEEAEKELFEEEIYKEI